MVYYKFLLWLHCITLLCGICFLGETYKYKRKAQQVNEHKRETATLLFGLRDEIGGLGSVFAPRYLRR